MPEAKVSVDVIEQLKSITVEVEIRRIKEAELRLWIAKHLFRLGCWIANLSLEEHQVVGVLITEKPEVPFVTK